MGLAIVKQLIELHGGTVSAESRGEGQGATFTLTLPLLSNHPSLSSNPPKPNRPTPQTLDSLPLAGLQIVLVDDQLDNLEFSQFVLEAAGATVIGKTSAIAALEAIVQSPPDLLISDIGMPDMDGYELLHQVRSRLNQPCLRSLSPPMPENSIEKEFERLGFSNTSSNRSNPRI
ncbi:MAG: response regulator [Leptolyngbyaceae cyanobacterium SU_3_3]|nr:response regulator [Leptolyngbyaceae cyanobacterium SU_3_3]